MTPRILLLATGLALAAGPPARAHDDHGTVTPLFGEAIPNVPGKSLRAVLVEYPPGAASPPHRHAASAFIYATVLEGAVRSQVDDGPARTYRAGEGWSEAPGAHHVVSANASPDRPARLLAVFVVDSAEQVLTIPDSAETRR
ncbi:hypothetical protein OPKNFCMD_2726 [Methylobacterium crusticola]|uniref:Cupin type-2 domain-containing protein n=1 Tax=Methylobacterium crusticola TaxID=1697972 RepID=A0ABQ4QZ32_9HYPH|nr:cupin domain-containing protein [Methylobacterium crusticola]GJD49990.1 hypothetical protein OPKNFCMD_2726 [Methylobacterium crusticola]